MMPSLIRPRQPVIKVPGPIRARPFLGQSGAADNLAQNGALIQVSIGMPDSVAQQMKTEGKTVPTPVQVTALIDTGASISAIDQGLASQLGLQQTGVGEVAGVTGMQQQAVYAGALTLTSPAVKLDPWKMIGSPLSVQNFQVLLGRDFLEQLTLVYEGSSGNFQLSPGGTATQTTPVTPTPTTTPAVTPTPSPTPVPAVTTTLAPVPAVTPPATTTPTPVPVLSTSGAPDWLKIAGSILAGSSLAIAFGFATGLLKTK